jgi:hypothetical protein
VRPIPAYKAGLYGLTENRKLSESNSKPPFIPVHRTGHSGNFSKMLFNLQRNSSEEIERLKGQIKALGGQWSYFYDHND